jgi:hypothetical protein
MLPLGGKFIVAPAFNTTSTLRAFSAPVNVNVPPAGTFVTVIAADAGRAAPVARASAAAATMAGADARW